jgi:hypothetical protein
MAKGELQLLDVAEPPVVSSSRNAPVDVGLDGDQAMGLARVDLQEAASYAPLTELTGQTAWRDAA